MPRDLPVGNGHLLVAFDKEHRIRDFYFPHVGEENHAGREPFRLGVWVDGRFSWVPEGWRIRRDYLDDSLVTDVELIHDGLELRLVINDLVDFHENIFLRRIRAENRAGTSREVRIFFSHDFAISGNEIGDTAAYRPEVKGLLHYKGTRYFLVGAFANKMAGIEQFATGNKRTGHFEGTWRDAEDGALGGNPIAQGSVDSTIAIPLIHGVGESETLYYWICAGQSWDQVRDLNSLMLKRGPETLFKRTRDYWNLWVNKEKVNLTLLPPAVARLYKRSLLILRTQIDEHGSIIAANDSDAVQYNRDTYSYMWPRDAALAAYALDLAGYPESTQKFFSFVSELLERGGYLLHKYTPSGSPASSWHPWLNQGHPQLPIQEDETALVIWALWQHFRRYRDVEFIKPLYRKLIRTAGDFLMNYRDLETGLPLPSYDLWEERQGVLSFTTAAVYGGLTAAGQFAEAFGETILASEYRQGAARMREATIQYLYLEQEQRFARMIQFGPDGRVEVDPTLDASLYGLFAFGAFKPDDPRVVNTMAQVRDKLWCRTPVGDLARYEDDGYHRVSRELPGNPWFVTTLWLAQYHIAAARTTKDLAAAREILEWVAARALPSGVLAEQIHPYTNEPLSVSPLTWSHASFILCVQEYLQKLADLDRCPACGKPK